jgi:hypothetical protein
MGMGSGAPMGAVGQAVGQTAQQPGVGGKGGFAMNAPTQLPPGVNLPMNGIPGNPGFPGTTPQIHIDPFPQQDTGQPSMPGMGGKGGVMGTRPNIDGLPPAQLPMGGIPGNPGFPDPRTMPQQPSGNPKGPMSPEMQAYYAQDAINQAIRSGQQPGMGGMPRDLGYGGNPFNPNGPRVLGQPGFIPRDLGYGGNPFNPNGPRGAVPQPGFPPRDLGYGNNPFNPNGPRVPAQPGFPPRDLGYGNNPFNPNGPRVPAQPGGPRPFGPQPVQVGPFGGFSGDPKPMMPAQPGFMPRDLGYGNNPFNPNGPRVLQQPVIKPPIRGFR